MGYDMYIMQERDQAEKDAITAAQAHLNSLPKPWDLPKGADRDAAEKAREVAYDALTKADRSYFRLNIWGMSRCRDLMAKLGMLTDEDAPSFPRLEDHGLDEWPEADDENLTDAERAFLAAADAVTDYEPQPVRGIPADKFGSNDGWLVTPAQITAALKAYERMPLERLDELADIPSWWTDWIAFLTYAQDRSGFRVH